MSIIIRLQNLPLSAKSADIRRFFAGLRIPNGGVHIVGGESGDAFIAFSSDEDARLAMRKDGGKIIDTRVKLYLSSHMEMQHEIERITKEAPPHRRSSNERQRFSRSPIRSDGRQSEAAGFYNDRNYRLPSPSRGRAVRGHSPRSRRSRSPRIRSRSPRRRSRSPRYRSRSPRVSYRRSRSPVGRRSSPLRGSVSPFGSRLTQSHFVPENERDRLSFRDINSQSIFEEDPSRRKRDYNMEHEQALLERKITEALCTGFESIEKMNNIYRNAPTVVMPGLGNDMSFQNLNPQLMPLPSTVHQEFNNFQHRDINNIQDTNLLPMTSWRQTPSNNFSEVVNAPLNFGPGIGSFPPPMSLPSMGHMSHMPPMTGPPPPIPQMAPPPVPTVPIPPMVTMQHIPPPATIAPVPTVENVQDMSAGNVQCPGFFITISGLDPAWHIGDVQKMLKGTFVPEKNIKWEIDDRGLKTGTAFIKFGNREDFIQLLSGATYCYNNRLITVSECPDHVFRRYFLPDWTTSANMNSPRGNFYYKMKGIPYIVTNEEVLSCFNGLEVSDLYIVFEKSGKAIGIGWVAFGNSEDYQQAMKRSGTKLGHRFIHMMPSSKRKMLETKRKNGDLLTQSKEFVPAKVPNKAPFEAPSAKRSLCALLTGLPPNIVAESIVQFIEASGVKPDAIHITLTNNNQPNGRAFAEFYNFRDFDAALRCHGNSIDGHIICVKQILYEEMIKILDTTRAQHSYKNMLESLTLNEPEKVPYLWHAPDNPQDKHGKFPRRMSPIKDSFRNKHNNSEYERPSQKFQVFEYENKSRNFEEQLQLESGSQFQNSQHDNKDKKWYPKEVPIDLDLQKMEEDDVIFLGVQEKQDVNRTPVKFDVKIKPSAVKNSKVDTAFDKNVGSEEKKKLSKLSPEKTTVPTPKAPINKPPEKPASKNKSSEDLPKEKAKSPEKNTKRRDRKNSPEKTNKRPFSKTETRVNINNRFKNETRRDRFKNRPRSRSDRFANRRRSPPRSDNLFYKSPERQELALKMDPFLYEGYGETVVQICNVDPILGSRELEHFLGDYNIDVNKIIRRFTDLGEPTGDIRVSFRNQREAERAVSELHGVLLNGIPIEMFILN